MDPLTALGVASNVIGIVDFSSKLIKLCKEAYGVVHDGSRQLQDVDYLTTGLQDALHRLEFHQGQPSSYCPQSPLRGDAEFQLHTLSQDCQKIAKELLDRVATFTARTSRGRTDRAKAMWRYIWYNQDLKATARRLDEYRIALETRIIICIRQDVMNQVAASQQFYTRFTDHEREVLAALKNGERDFAGLQNAVHSLRTDVAQGFDRILQLIQDNFGAQSRASTIERVEEVYQSLKYEGWDYRQAAVADAHQGTESWILDRSPKSEWPSLVDWLQGVDPHPIYWIAGKPGAGKSTLMKYLAEDRITTVRNLMEQLNRVSMTSAIVATHFFFSRGSDLQKSICGMLRSLIFQVLKQLPAQKMDVLDDLATHTTAGDKSQWSQGVLLRTFRHVLSCLEPGSVLCLMVDGLDECSDDHDDLTQIFQKVAQSKDASIRILLASRQWPEFRDSLEHSDDVTTLYLHDHTASDIGKYVTGRLNETRNFRNIIKTSQDEAEQLISTLTYHARGSWIWVKIAVKRIRRLLQYGKTNIYSLLHEASQLPIELVDLYDHVIKRIDPQLREDCAILFQLFVLLDQVKQRSIYATSPHLAPYFQLSHALLTNAQDDVFALTARYRNKTHELESFDSLLQGATGGLLEIVHVCIVCESKPGRLVAELDHTCSEGKYYIKCLHLTVSAWLERDKTRSRLNEWHPLTTQNSLQTSIVKAAFASLPLFQFPKNLSQYVVTTQLLSFTDTQITSETLALYSRCVLCAYQVTAVNGDFPQSVDESQAWKCLFRPVLEEILPPRTQPVFDPLWISSGSQEPLSCSPVAFCMMVSILTCSARACCVDLSRWRPLTRRIDCSFVLIVLALNVGDYKSRNAAPNYILEQMCTLLDYGADPNVSPGANGCSAWACFLLCASDWYMFQEQDEMAVMDGEKDTALLQAFFRDSSHSAFLQAVERFLEHNATPIEQLNMPFRRLKEGYRTPLASQCLPPPLLKILAENKLYTGVIPSREEWIKLCEEEGWQWQDLNGEYFDRSPINPLGSRSDLTHSNKAADYYGGENMAVDEETRRQRIESIIKERDVQCREIIRRMESAT